MHVTPTSSTEQEILDTTRTWAKRVIAEMVLEAGGEPREWQASTSRMVRLITGNTTDLLIEAIHTRPGDFPVVVASISIGPTLEQTKPRFVKAMRKGLRKAYPDAPREAGRKLRLNGYWLGGIGAGIGVAVTRILDAVFTP